MTETWKTSRLDKFQICCKPRDELLVLGVYNDCGRNTKSLWKMLPRGYTTEWVTVCMRTCLCVCLYVFVCVCIRNVTLQMLPVSYRYWTCTQTDLNSGVQMWFTETRVRTAGQTEKCDSVAKPKERSQHASFLIYHQKWHAFDLLPKKSGKITVSRDNWQVGWSRYLGELFYNHV